MKSTYDERPKMKLVWIPNKFAKQFEWNSLLLMNFCEYCQRNAHKFWNTFDNQPEIWSFCLIDIITERWLVSNWITFSTMHSLYSAPFINNWIFFLSSNEFCLFVSFLHFTRYLPHQKTIKNSLHKSTYFILENSSQRQRKWKWNCLW